ncbi:TonB-dependent siderophore receptor [Pseudomonas sp. RIT-PI-AD]|uniref:TonB-dependent siderophore receptor n=1 Tax=Pseudomonas sp. RIT-PI-AD TaxID=3035294 RepID=UPI0021DA0E60|nr:TonB-dependent siderophore receptor [Pseudomonas sp. RIT-PI-AD]
MRPFLLLPLALCSASVLASDRLVDYALPAGPLTETLMRIGQLSGRQVLFVPADVQGRQAAGVSGRLDAAGAVRRALQGSGLRIQLTASGAISVQPGEDGSLTLGNIDISGAAPGVGAEDDGGYVAHRARAATKTDTDLVKVPQSISVVTRAEMDARKSDNLADALQYTPGLLSQPSGFSRTADDFTLRGFNVGSGSGGILRDGMKLQSNPYDGSVEAYGLERVEVLKGASSVLYGQLSPGGVINTLSKRPTDTPLHELGLEYGNHDRRQYTFDLGDRLDEQGRFSYRLTGLWRDSGTAFDHVDDDRRYIAPALGWHPDDDTSLTLLASHQETFTQLAPPLPYAMTDYSDTAGRKVGRHLFVGEPGYDHFNNRMDTLGYLFEHRFSDSLKLNHSLRYFQADTDWNYLIPYALSGDRLLRRYSERDERSTGWTSDNSLQWDLGNARWQHKVLTGVDYYHKTYDSHRSISASLAQLAPPLDLADPRHTGVGANTAADSGSDLHSNQAGVYLQDQITFDERWVLLLGGRRDWARTATDSYASHSRQSRDDSKTTGRLGVVYLFDNGLAPYLSYSQSFQPASVNNPAYGNAFAPLEGEQYEAGLRYQPPGSDTLLSAAVYTLTQKNALSYDAETARYVQYGKTRAKGLELEAKSSFSDNLDLSAAYSYTDARILEDRTEANVGRRLEAVPYHSANLWVSYRLADLGLPQLKVAAGARYTGTTRTSSSGYDGKIPGYTLVDALVSYRLDDHWDVSAKAQNLMNKHYLYCGTTCRYGDERSLIGSVNYRW